MTHQLFDELIGTPPPSTVDVHALVRREQRARTVRHAGYGMTALVAAAVSVGLLVAAPNQPTATPPAPAGAQSLPTQNTRFQLLANDQASAEASAKHLSEALDRALKRAAPNASWETITGSSSNPTADELPYIAPIFTDGPSTPAKYFSGIVNITAGGRHGALTLMTLQRAEPGEQTPKPPILLECAGEAGCTESTGPNGEKVVTMVTQQGNYKNHEVRIELAGNRLLTISVSNVDSNPDNTGTPPLTTTQITTIAADLAGQIKA